MCRVHLVLLEPRAFRKGEEFAKRTEGAAPKSWHKAGDEKNDAAENNDDGRGDVELKGGEGFKVKNINCHACPESHHEGGEEHETKAREETCRLLSHTYLRKRKLTEQGLCTAQRTNKVTVVVRTTEEGHEQGNEQEQQPGKADHGVKTVRHPIAQLRQRQELSTPKA